MNFLRDELNALNAREEELLQQLDTIMRFNESWRDRRKGDRRNRTERRQRDELREQQWQEQKLPGEERRAGEDRRQPMEARLAALNQELATLRKRQFDLRAQLQGNQE